MRLRYVAQMASLVVGLGLFVAQPTLAQSAPAGDPVAGKQVFETKCAVCHSLTPGRKSVGPSLIGVFGKPAGTNDPTYSYSDEMKNSGKTWDAPTLDVYLTNPRADIHGMKMLFVGLPDATDRANLIAFLATLK